MAQHRSVTEIALKSSFLCVKRSLTRYGFRAGARVIQYNVNIALFTFSCLLSSLKLREVTNHECLERLIKYIYIYIYIFFSIACRSNDSPNNCTVFLLYYYF